MRCSFLELLLETPLSIETCGGGVKALRGIAHNSHCHVSPLKALQW